MGGNQSTRGFPPGDLSGQCGLNQGELRIHVAQLPSTFNNLLESFLYV